ncbi:MSMEG_0567/sll0787 family protein [Aquihabitans sp. G128]|uniref:MSMEG_0567/sll0787 family protein n=1 Tax=Aquihabitans sp. G128 TaxID=2849779 RepID=UPI00352C053E
MGDVLVGSRLAPPASFTVHQASSRAELDAYARLRRDVFVAEQGLFAGSDRDDLDDLDERIVLVAREVDGTVVGGVRLTPGVPGRDLAWWVGSRLVVAGDRRGSLHIGAALIGAACARAEQEGALRFDATVQAARVPLFGRLGWTVGEAVTVAGTPHRRVRWPIGRVQRLVDATKGPLGAVLEGLAPGGPGWVGDDAAPVPGSDLLAACDAIVPAMVARDPWWAGWCSVLVNANDLAAMGATPVGLLDAIGAPTASLATRAMAGMKAGAEAWGVPVLGGHTTLGVPASLAVTMLGRTASPVPGGGGRVGDAVEVAADLGGRWRAGHTGRQWDSTTSRSPEELRALQQVVAQRAPHAAKDVSMTGLVGTLGMLAEASGCGAELDLAAVPSPDGAGLADWLTCFPGFAMVMAVDPSTTSPAPTTAPSAGRSPLPATTASCGRLTAGAGVAVRWPDGEVLRLVDGPVTNLGPAGGSPTSIAKAEPTP